jgi:hypothetical protein
MPVRKLAILKTNVNSLELSIENYSFSYKNFNIKLFNIMFVVIYM